VEVIASKVVQSPWRPRICPVCHSYNPVHLS